MPTGYTADLTEQTTLKEFALRCARAFGALIDMRDDPLDAPIPDEFKPSGYHQTALDDALSEQAAVRTMTLDDAARGIAEHNRRQAQHRENDRAEKTKKRAAYERMIRLVEVWQEPSPDHVNMKKFMLDQLRESLDWDCKDYSEYHKDFTGTPQEWLVHRFSEAERNVAYHRKHLDEDLERARERSQWVRQLLESLLEKTQ